MRNLLAPAMLLSLLALSPAQGQAQAQKDAKQTIWWSESPWHVVHEDSARGCWLAQRDDRRSVLRVVWSAQSDAYFMTAATGGWSGFKDGGKFTIDLRFEPAGRLARPAVAFGTEDAPTLAWADLDRELLEAMGSNSRLKIAVGSQIVADIDLEGMGHAMGELQLCNEEKLGLPWSALAAPLTATLLAPRPNKAQGAIERWKIVEQWFVGYDKSLKGCFIAMTHGPGAEIRVGRAASGDNYYFSLENKAWTWIEDGRPYDLRLQLKQDVDEKVSAIGAKPRDGKSPPSLRLTKLTRDFVDRFSTSSDLTVIRGEEAIESVRPKHTVAALREMDACQKAHP